MMNDGIRGPWNVILTAVSLIGQTGNRHGTLDKPSLSPNCVNSPQPVHVDSLVHCIDSTCVAAITQWESENAIRFCSYDMGGAGVYKVLHQHFMDKDAITVLVYNHRTLTEEVGATRVPLHYDSNVRLPSSIALPLYITDVHCHYLYIISVHHHCASPLCITIAHYHSASPLCITIVHHH